VLIFTCIKGHEITVSDDVIKIFWRCPFCGSCYKNIRALTWKDKRRHALKLLNYGIQKRLINES